MPSRIFRDRTMGFIIKSITSRELDIILLIYSYNYLRLWRIFIWCTYSLTFDTLVIYKAIVIYPLTTFFNMKHESFHALYMHIHNRSLPQTFIANWDTYILSIAVGNGMLDRIKSLDRTVQILRTAVRSQKYWTGPFSPVFLLLRNGDRLKRPDRTVRDS